MDAPARSRPPRWPLPVGVAVILAALLGTAGYTLKGSREQTLARETADLERIARVLATHSQRIYFGADLLLASIEDHMGQDDVRSAEAYARVAGSREMHEALRDRVVQAPDVDGLVLIAADGRLLNTSRRWPPPTLNLADRDYYVALRDQPERPFVVTEAFSNRVTGTETLFREVRDPNARSRHVFAFHRPETLRMWATAPDTLRGHLERPIEPPGLPATAVPSGQPE